MLVSKSYLKSKQKHLRNSAKIRGITFDLSIKDLERSYQVNICPYFGTPLVEGQTSIDRKDSTKGYTKDNIIVCSTKANNLKNQLFENEITKITSDELLHFVNKLL